MSITSIRLSDDLDGPLNELASKLERSKNYIINQAIKEYLERQSVDELRWQETLEALESVKSGKAIDSNSVHEWLASWGTTSEKTAPKV